MTAGVLAGTAQLIVTLQQFSMILTASIGTGLAATHTRRVLDVDYLLQVQSTLT